MIRPKDVEGLDRKYQDKCLADIEEKMDYALKSAAASGSSYAFLTCVEDYEMEVRNRVLSELCPKYEAAGWPYATTKPHFTVWLNEPPEGVRQEHPVKTAIRKAQKLNESETQPTIETAVGWWNRLVVTYLNLRRGK